MSKEKKFTIVGTAVNTDGTIKVRWANDLVSRIKILAKSKCTDIDLIELPKAMTKLAATKFFLDNKTGLTDAQKEILDVKVSEKSRATKRADMKTTLTQNVKTRIKENKKTDPRVENFVTKATKVTSAE